MTGAVIPAVRPAVFPAVLRADDPRLALLGGTDPDAAAYVAAIVAAGATVSGAQIKAISDFCKAGKAHGWWPAVKRFYLPVWAVAAPNAICLASRTSGSFPVPGGVSHAAGYIEGNGSTGYFAPDAAAKLVDLGCSNASLHLMLAQSQAATVLAVPIGEALDGTAAARNQIVDNTTASGTLQFISPTNNTGVPVNFTSNNRLGVIVGSVTATNARFLKQSGNATTGKSTTNDTTAVTNQVPFIMARNTGGSATLLSNARIQAAGFGTKLTETQADAYIAAMVTLLAAL